MTNQIARYTLAAGTEATNVIRVRVTAEDLAGNIVPVAFKIRCKIANDGDYDGTSTNATIAAVTGSSTSIWTHTGTKDLTLQAATTNGYLDVDVTDASAETVTFYIGEPVFGGEGADCSEDLDLVFA